jgi:ATP-binding cassette subfamily B protein
MMRSILKQPGAASMDASSGEIINTFRDDVEQAEYSISGTLDVLGTAIFAITAIIMLSSISVKITFLVFAPLVAVVIVAQIASKKIEKYRKASREATGKVSGTIGEMFTYVQAVKASGAEDNIINHFKFLNKQRHKMMLKNSVFSQVLDSIFGNTVSLGTGLILLFTTQSMNAGTFTVGDFTLFAYNLTFITEFIQLIGVYIADYPQTGVSFRRMSSLIKGENEDSLVKHNKIYLKSELPEIKSVEMSKEECGTWK